MELTADQVERIEAEIAKQPPEVQQRYREMVAKGQSPRFAIMAAMQSAPLTRQSDRTFNASRRYHMNHLKPWALDYYLREAKKAGISTQGKFYVGGLGRPTNSDAWVSSVDDVRAACAARQLSSSGLVEVQGPSVDPPQPKPMAEDIQLEYVARKMAQDPQLVADCKRNPEKLQKLKAEAVDRHAKRRSPRTR